MSLVIVSNSTPECLLNPCNVMNGGCEDICAIDDNTKKVVCGCREGRMRMVEDKTRCVSNTLTCSDNRFQFQCSTPMKDGSPICIPFNLTCDGISHCIDDSDESDSYCAVRECKGGYFRCGNNKCVLESKR